MQRDAGRRRWLLAATTLAAGGLATGAWAQAGGEAQLEELVVTAQKRAENVQDVPLSITAVSGRDLEAANVTNFRELTAMVPALRMEGTNNTRNTTVSLRGIGNSGNNPGIEYSVGVFLDGVYLPGLSVLQGDLVDIQAVEVLRGPQGTLYGRNTPVGAINIITREPQAKPEAMVTAGFGNYQQRYAKGYVGGALGEDLSARASFWLRDRDGFARNLATGGRVNDMKGGGARLRTMWTPNDDLKFNLVGHYSIVRSKGGVADAINPTGPGGVATPGFLAETAALGYTFQNFTSGDFVVQADDVTNDKAISYGASLTGEFELPAGHTLTSITAWDVNVGGADPYSADALPQNVAKLIERGEIESFSEELRVSSPTGGFFEYIAGLYLYRQTYDFWSTVTVGPDANRLFPLPAAAGGPQRFREGDQMRSEADLKTRSTALFGTARLNFTDRWRASLGARYVWEKKDGVINHTNSPGTNAAFQALFGPNPIGAVERSEEKFTWLLSTQYDLTPDIMAFASVSTGYKAGGFNARRQAPTAPVQFEPESSIDYQLGLKSQLLDRRLRLNLTLFNMVLSDFQESILNPVTRSGFLTGNAGERRVRGLEGDFAAVVGPNLRFSGGLTYLDAEFTDYTIGPCYAGRTPNGSQPNTCSFNGLTPVSSPKWKFNVAGDYSRQVADDLMFNARLEVQHTSSMLLDAALDPRSRQKAVTLLNGSLSLGAEARGWSGRLWVKNLTDEHYYQRIGGIPLAPMVSTGGTAGAEGFHGYYAEPRTYGLELTYRY
ncbi:TonB-dependent receptor [Phenylobacterium sp.]|uniref:TonB-dependent receptor n=1 Tax=Phenylobacterium sp. TaxID=1871053 RepID=UPI00301D3466